MQRGLIRFILVGGVIVGLLAMSATAIAAIRRVSRNLEKYARLRLEGLLPHVVRAAVIA